MARRGDVEVVRVFDELPELLDDATPEVALAAGRLAVARGVELAPGAWEPGTRRDDFRGWWGLLVVDGVLTRTVTLGRRRSQEILGRRDLLRPWDDDSCLASLPSQVTWRVVDRARIALLDARFVVHLTRWPELSSAFFAAAVKRSYSRSMHLAFTQTRRADVRLLQLFWHLADRWGRVGPDGVVVPLRLTHEQLAELVSLRRPTVSAALRDLQARGDLVRRPGGGWVLPQSFEDLDELLGAEGAGTANLDSRPG